MLRSHPSFRRKNVIPVNTGAGIQALGRRTGPLASDALPDAQDRRSLPFVLSEAKSKHAPTTLAQP